MRNVISAGHVVAVPFLLLALLLSGCQSYMASCDGEPFTEEKGMSFEKLRVGKWTVTTEKRGLRDDKDHISSYCGVTGVSQNVMSLASFRESEESSIPVKISVSSTAEGNNGWIASLWNVPAYLSLAILPVVESDKVAYTIQARTVVGTHEKTVEICNRSWLSVWTPLALMPVPGWANFRAAGNSGKSLLNEYHEGTVAASVVQLLSEMEKADLPKYNSDRSRYDGRIVFERSVEAMQATFDLVKDINREESLAAQEGKIVRYSKYSRKGKYRGERYQIVGHPSISEYKEFRNESDAKMAIAEAASELQSRRRQAFEKATRDELKVAKKLVEVKDVRVIELYEGQLKGEMLRARSSELKGALTGCLEKLRLRRKSTQADKLLEEKNWQELQKLCMDEKDTEFVLTYGPKAEHIRVEEVCKEMNDALEKGDCHRALALSKDESDETIKALAAKAEQMRQAKICHEIEGLLAKGDWQHVLTLARNEKNEQIKTLAAKAKACGIKEKGAEVEELLAKEDWSAVLALCEKLQSEIELAEFVRKCRTRAESVRKSIEARDRAAELKRIESRKIQIGRLLASKDYAAVIAECDKERGGNPGARSEDQQIWASFKRKAARAKAEMDRDAELRRIAEKVNLIEKLLEKQDYDSVIKACDEEHGTNVGSSPEDMAQWKAYRSKALGLRLLAKAKDGSKSVCNIKGFYLGMSMEEVEILLNYYIPSISFERKDDQIKIGGHEMIFCQAENGKVVRINLNKSILEKMFGYDVQTTREWTMNFGKEYSIDFRTYRIRDRKSRGGASVSVSQNCYMFKDRNKGVSLTIFDEQDVDDYNQDPKEIRAHAEQRVFQGMLAGVMDENLAFSMGAEAGLEAENVIYVRNWLKKTFVNGKGAEEGTLRMEMAR